MVATDRVQQAFGLIRIEALRCKDLPRGVTVDDLESVGGEALMEASANFDPTTGAKWMGHARLWIRNRMRSFLGQARILAKRLKPLAIETPDGEFPRPDKRSVDPAEMASAKEAVLNRRLANPAVVAAQVGLPSPDQVAEKVARLRAAMFAGVQPTDPTEVMKMIVRKAIEHEDLKAAKLFLDYLAPKASTTGTVVVVNHGEM